MLNSFIDHRRDLDFSYAAVKQLEGKYFVQNRVTGQIYESAQFLYILVAACLFAKYPKATRLDYVKRFYDATSTFKISLPTPIMSGVRTPTRQFSSCVLIECGDSLILSTRLPALSYATFLNVLVSASTRVVFVRWVLKSVVVKHSTPVVSHSTSISRLPLNVAHKAAFVAVQQRYSTHCGTAKQNLCWF